MSKINMVANAHARTPTFSGYYIFSMFYQTLDETVSDLAITVNDGTLCSADAPADYQHSSCTAAVQLDEGGVVNVKALHGDTVLFLSDGGRAIGFSGSLYLAL